MFFSTYVLTKKGPLAKIWLAAHWDKKLTKHEIRAIDLNQTIVQIVQPVVPIALRTSGELLIGVVRVYALKVKQLLKDATEATILLRTANIQLIKTSGKGGDQTKEGFAVTMDLVVSKGGVEELCEADFDGIADLLKGNRSTLKNKRPADDGSEVVGSAWFTLEPSQYLEEQLVDTQGVDDGIAKMRADLLAFGDDEQRRSESAGSKKSSVSSVEKGRTSQVVIGDDLLDVGAPLPDDILLSAIPADGLQADQFMDPAAVFDVAELDAPVAPTEAGQRLPKKLKPINVLDAAATVLSKAEIEKCTKDRSDIVNTERRCGPINALEEIDRQSLRSAEVNILSLDPISYVANPALRAVYSASLKSSVSAVLREVEQGRASQKPVQQERKSEGVTGLLPDELAFNDMDHMLAAPDIGEALEEVQPRPSGKKRGRDDVVNDDSTQPFSASTVATLESLRTVLRANRETTFAKFSRSMRRVDAARTFVDVLALASHNALEVRQNEPYGEIKLLSATA